MGKPDYPYGDLCPGLFDGRHLFAAPADSDRLFCLDAMTGQLLWDREGVDVVHLLGVVRGRLIATCAAAVSAVVTTRSNAA